MLIPTGMRYTSRLKASEWKTVSCEHCPQDYAYQVTREGNGSGRSVLFLDNDGARGRAANEAEADLERQLETAVEAVWCPRCGKYQSDMHREVRLQSGCLAYALAAVLVVVGVVVCMFWGETSFLENLLGGPGLWFGAVALVVALAGFVRASMIDPDAEAAKRAGTVATFVPVLTREEYRLARKAALAKGVSKRELAKLSWPRPLEEQPRKAPKKKKQAALDSAPAADGASGPADEAQLGDGSQGPLPEALPRVCCSMPICKTAFDLPSPIAEMSWPVRCPSCNWQLAPEDRMPANPKDVHDVGGFVGPLLIERGGELVPLRVDAPEERPSLEEMLAE